MPPCDDALWRRPALRWPRAVYATFLATLMLGALFACHSGDKATSSATNTGGEPNAAEPNTASNANGPAVLFRGRFDTVTDPNVPAMSWPGCEIEFGFSGSKLSITLSAPDAASYNGQGANVFLAYAVDGGNAQTLLVQSAKTDYVLAQNLTPGQHTVRVSKMTEGQFGRIFYYGVATDGAMSYTPAATGRRIEFVGDSGTAGYGVLGTYPCTFSVPTEDADLAYPALVGRLLQAEARNISYSGKGLVQNRDVINDAYKTMPVLWQRTLPVDEPYVLWDFNQWVPQAVVSIVSGNDVYASIPTQDVVTQKIQAFIASLRSAYPQALLLFGISPMLRTNDPHPNQRATITTYLQNALTQVGDANVSYLDLPQDDGFNGENCATTGCDASDPNCLGACFGCDDHMTPTTQALVAQTIATALKSKLGW